MKILKFPDLEDTKTKPVDALNDALEAGLKSVLIIGFDEENLMYYTGSSLNKAQAAWMCDVFKNLIINGG
jgi:coenzyme F420-reducing hydrogenase delta subunit